MADAPISLTAVSIKPRYLTVYQEYQSRRGRTQAQIDNERNLRNNQARPEISEKARKRIRNAIDWFLLLAKEKKAYNAKLRSWYTFKLAFITLTLAAKQRHSDKEVKSKLLNQMLTEMRSQCNVTRYIWRAEPQKNGNIHFHIVVDQYIPHNWLRSTWNRIQEKLGYISDFEKRNGHRDANSTDIHSIRKVRNLSAYMAKYMTKENDRREIEGRQWFISQSLSQYKSATEYLWDDLKEEVYRLIDHEQCKVRYDDYFTLLLIDSRYWNNDEYPTIQQVFNDYLNSSNRVN